MKSISKAFAGCQEGTSRSTAALGFYKPRKKKRPLVCPGQPPGPGFLAFPVRDAPAGLPGRGFSVRSSIALLLFLFRGAPAGLLEISGASFFSCPGLEAFRSFSLPGLENDWDGLLGGFRGQSPWSFGQARPGIAHRVLYIRTSRHSRGES